MHQATHILITHAPVHYSVNNDPGVLVMGGDPAAGHERKSSSWGGVARVVACDSCHLPICTTGLS